jgi:uncharacterized protein (UPF0332 family)
MIEREVIYLEKAMESIAGAESEYVNSRYNNCANRSYYACFHAAVHALSKAGITSRRPDATWAHEALQAASTGELIQRRKHYPSELRDVLPRNSALRLAADYKQERVSETQASRALRRARSFVSAVTAEGGEK